MSSTGLTRQDLRARARRFASLRAAQRALAPSVRADHGLPGADRFLWIRDELQMLVDRIGSRPDASIALTDLGRVDHALASYADQLREVADRIAMAQFRASVPEFLPDQRGEVAALLDLLLEDETLAPERVPLVTYLITQLSAVKLEGGWTIVAEPSNLSEMVQRRSLHAPADEGSQIAERFQEASLRLDGGANLDDVVNEMRVYKEEIAEHLFGPDVLRSIVTYNLKVRTAFEGKLAQARARDAEVVQDVGSATACEENATSPGEATPFLDSPMGAPGLVAIEQALARRLSGADPKGDPAAAIAARLDLDRLEKVDAAVFADSSGENFVELGRRTITFALVLESLTEIDGSLRDLGLDPARLGSWAGELLDRGRRETGRLLTCQAAREAQWLSGVQSRFLLRALGTIKPEPTGAAPSSPPTTLSRRRPVRAAHRKRSRELPDWCRVHPAVWGLALVVCGGLAGVALTDWIHVDPRAVETLSQKKLRNVSPLLVSAYRNGEGDGGLFIGTLSPQWLTLEPWERDEGAKHIQQQLTGSGVHEILLYDASRVLRVHYANDRFRVLDRRPASG